MPEIDIVEFDAKLNGLDGGSELKEIVALLRRAAEQAGIAEWSAHSTAGGGWGVTGRAGRRVVCRFDPKPSVLHVCVCVPQATESELKVAGRVHRRKNGPAWVDVCDLTSAEALVPALVRACTGFDSTPRRSKVGTKNLGGTPRVADVESRTRGTPRRRRRARQSSIAVVDDLAKRGFQVAGVIEPVSAGRSCRFTPAQTQFRGTVVYGLVVGPQLMKSGDTGRKNATLVKRMEGCAATISDILSGALVGPFTEHFKSRAPGAIRANQKIQVWAKEAPPEECRRLQRELNQKYDTIQTGWANRLE